MITALIHGIIAVRVPVSAFFLTILFVQTVHDKMVKTMLSLCCGAIALVRGHTTKYYVCSRCGRPCDVKTEGR